MDYYSFFAFNVIYPYTPNFERFFVIIFYPIIFFYLIKLFFRIKHYLKLNNSLRNHKIIRFDFLELDFGVVRNIRADHCDQVLYSRLNNLISSFSIPRLEPGILIDKSYKVSLQENDNNYNLHFYSLQLTYDTQILVYLNVPTEEIDSVLDYYKNSASSYTKAKYQNHFLNFKDSDTNLSHDNDDINIEMLTYSNSDFNIEKKFKNFIVADTVIKSNIQKRIEQNDEKSMVIENKSDIVNSFDDSVDLFVSNGLFLKSRLDLTNPSNNFVSYLPIVIYCKPKNPNVNKKNEILGELLMFEFDSSRKLGNNNDLFPIKIRYHFLVLSSPDRLLCYYDIHGLDEDDNTCIICFTKPRCVLLSCRCRQVLMCEECLKSEHFRWECPMCRTPVSSYVTIDNNYSIVEENKSKK